MNAQAALPPGTYKIAARIGDPFPTFRVLDAGGNDVVRFKDHVAFKKERWTVETPDQQSIGELHHQKFSFKHYETYTLERPDQADVTMRFDHVHGFGGSTWTIDGSAMGPLKVVGQHIDYRFDVLDPSGNALAVIHRAKVTVRDAFSIEIQQAADPLVLIATTVALAHVHEEHAQDDSNLNFSN